MITLDVKLDVKLDLKFSGKLTLKKVSKVAKFRQKVIYLNRVIPSVKDCYQYGGPVKVTNKSD